MPIHFGPLIVALLALVVVFRRSGKARKVKLVRMWISPAISALATAGTLASEPFPGWFVLTAYLAAGAGGTEVGLLRAHHADLSVDPKSRKVFIQANAIGSALAASFFAARFGSKLVFPELRGHSHAGNNVDHLADGLLIFTVAMLFAQNFFVRSRVRQMLAAQSAEPAGIPATPAVEPPAAETLTATGEQTAIP